MMPQQRSRLECNVTVVLLKSGLAFFTDGHPWCRPEAHCVSLTHQCWYVLFDFDKIFLIKKKKWNDHENLKLKYDAVSQKQLKL